MSADLHSLLFGALVVGLLVSGCASTSAPDAWQSTAQTMQQEAYGAWIDVRFASPTDTVQTSRMRGELVAVGDDSLWVLPLEGTLQSVSRATTSQVQLTTFDSNWGYLATWTALGTLSTISHGFGLILSGPVWILGGSAVAGNQSYKPIFENPDTEVLRRYARFPQGLPPGVSRKELVAKPLP